MQSITPFLWFDNQAEEAANFYVSLFKNAKIKAIARYNEQSAKMSGRANGSVMTVSFELNGQEYIALNGGPVYKLSPSFSLMVHCQTQDEIDFLWDKLSDGGEILQCGWLTDRYGVTWQIVPAMLGAIMQDKDAAKAARVMAEIHKMTKLDIERLTRA
jgi:predicted 3-demethylubiquinone-9 3-methyltransferase (glyoxalase superfamily)